jgi:hypothetical protein
MCWPDRAQILDDEVALPSNRAQASEERAVDGAHPSGTEGERTTSSRPSGPRVHTPNAENEVCGEPLMLAVRGREVGGGYDTI